MEVFLFFAIYAFLGCAAENVYHLILHKRYVSKRTLLTLPMCPIYGIAALLLLAVNGKTQNLLLLFCAGFLTVSAAELIFYLISLRVYGIKWWDYSDLKINFMGGVSLFYSTLWGILNIVFAKILHPAVAEFIGAIPENTKILCGIFLMVFFAADAENTHKELLKYKKGEKNLIKSNFLYLKNNN